MTDEELIEAYTVQELSTTEIGRLINISSSWIHTRLVGLGVTMRGRSGMSDRRREEVRQMAIAGARTQAASFEPRDHDFLTRILAAGGYQNAHIAERQRRAA